jgi:hypothetical protein
MLTGLPPYIIITFLAAVISTYQLFISSVKNKINTSVVILIWLSVTAALAFNEFFLDTSGMPPRFTLAVAPALVFIAALLFTRQGQSYTDRLDLRTLTLLHIVRLPVELVLYWLSVHKVVPELMTFAGRNFDIIAGVSAPVMYFLCFSGKQVMRRNLLLAWNIICLGLLLNIVIHAVLSAPFPIQQFAFEQPNIAVLYFPFVWLPSFIVMVVLFSHLAAIRRLLMK